MTRDEKIAVLIERDIKTVKEDIDNRDFEYLTAILMGDGWTQYNSMSDERIDEEYQCQVDSQIDKIFPSHQENLNNLTILKFSGDYFME